MWNLSLTEADHEVIDEVYTLIDIYQRSVFNPICNTKTRLSLAG